LKSRGNVQKEAVKDVLEKLRQSVNILVSLVNLCKVHDKVILSPSSTHVICLAFDLATRV